VSESQKVERFRSALPPLAPPLGRIPAKLDQPRLIRMQSQSELCQTFSKFRQIRPRCPLLLEAHHTVVCVSLHDDLPSPWLFPPVLNPKIEGVVQVDIRQQRRNHRPLRRSLHRGNPLPIFDHSRFEPFTDQANDPLIGNPVFEETEHPNMVDFVEK